MVSWASSGMLNPAVILFWLALCAAQPVVPLTVYESQFYVIETHLPVDRARFIGRVMDATGKEYARRFEGFRGVVRRKPKVRVYSDRESYLAAFARACGEPSIHARGFFCGLDGIVYTYDGKGLGRILQHECFHQFARIVIGGRLPKWTDEGLAEYFQEGVLDETSGRMELGAVPAWRLELLRKAAAAGTLLPVRTLMNLSSEEWRAHLSDERGVLQYSQAWLMCHFLVHGEDGKYRSLFEQYLHRLDEGLDGDTAFKRVFGADLGPFAEALGRYLRQLEPASGQPKREGE